jgi:transcriptional regulator with XRE-family HTH domain
MSATTNIQFRDWLETRMTDPEFRAAWEVSEPAYQVARLRVKRGLTQEQLAELVGTHQASIARLESGKVEPRLSFLRKVAKALQGHLTVQIVPEEEVSAVKQPSVAPVVQTRVYPEESILTEWPAPEKPRRYSSAVRGGTASVAPYTEIAVQ